MNFAVVDTPHSDRRARRWMAWLLLLVLTALVAHSAERAAAATLTEPLLTVVRVEPNVAITVRATGFPGGLTWYVREAASETGVLNAPIVAGFVSPTSGTAYVRIPIAPDLAGNTRIFFRAVSGQLFSYNFAENQAFDDGSLAFALANGAAVIDGGGFYIGSGQTEGGGFYIGSSQTEGGGFYIGSSTPLGTTELSAEPTVAAIAVDRGVSATIQTQNLPSNRIYTVRMNDPAKAWNVDAYTVGTVYSGLGGSVVATMPIPPELAHLPVLRVHLRSNDGIYAFNNFYNAVTP